MKKFFSSMRGVAMASAGLLLMGSILTSCLKDHDDNSNATDVAAGLMAVNLAPGQSSVGFEISGNPLTQVPLAYNSFTGTYLSIYPGSRTVSSFNWNSGDTLASAGATFETGKYYSVFLVGSDSTLENVVVRDNVDSLSSASQAFVRYINAVADPSSATVTIAAGGNNIVNESANFKRVSEFVPVNAGSVDVSINNGAAISASRTITLESQKVYTILLIGKPGGTGDEAVQVKFIENGQVDNTSAARISSTSSNRAIK